MKPQLSIFKVGGKVVENERSLADIIAALVRFPQAHIIVHGGGNIASELMQKMGIHPQFVEGRRITDAASLEVAIMVYAGLINKQIVAAYNAASMSKSALGLCGADLNIVRSTRRSPEPIDFGFVGDITAINTSQLCRLLEQEITPICCAITATASGQLLNTNADTVASSLAVALADYYAVELVYLFEHSGVLADVNDAHSTIASIDYASFMALVKQGVIKEGMIPKLENAFNAIQHNVTSVVIAHHEDVALYKERGTTIECKLM